jgi:hypothetical protein
VAIVAAVAVVLGGGGVAAWRLGWLESLGGSRGSAQWPDSTDRPQLSAELPLLSSADLESKHSLEVAEAPLAGHLIVRAEPDFSAYTESLENWYEGYEEDYDWGYANGLAYLESSDGWREDFIDSSYGEDRTGYWAGFEVGANGDEYGTNRLSQPDAAAMATVVASFNLATRANDWTVDLTEAVGFDMAEILTISGTHEKYVALAVGERLVQAEDGIVAAKGIVVLDAGDGSVVGKRTWVPEASGDLVWFAGDVAVLADSETVSAYGLADIAGEPLWQAPAPDLESDSSIAVPGCCVLTDGGYVDIATGRSLGFGLDAGEDLRYYFDLQPGSEELVAFRIETFRWDSDSGTTDSEILRIDPKTGRELWGEPVTEVYVHSDMSSRALFFTGADSRTTAYSVRSGQELWSARLSCDSPQSVGERWLVCYDSATGSSDVYSANDGQRLFSESWENGAPAVFKAGERTLYADQSGTLYAYDLTSADKGELLWRLRHEPGSFWLLTSGQVILEENPSPSLLMSDEAILQEERASDLATFRELVWD